MVALMTEMLDISRNHKVLEIGTGSGYQSAVLAVLCDNVYSIERIGELSTVACENLLRTGYKVNLKVGDGTLGWSEYAPYDRIIVTAGAPEMPPSLFEQLTEGGYMVVPVGSRSVQTLKLYQKVDGQQIIKSSYDCVFVPLIGTEGWKEEKCV
jgi:protein-L-isoaspartate(D-aspartate) O-methyltransferase